MAIELTEKMKKLKLMIWLILPVFLFGEQADHILFTQVAVRQDAEMFAISNPTESDVNLSNYFVTDATKQTSEKYYYNLPSGSDYSSFSPNDFFGRFPEIVILAGDTLTVSLTDSSTFKSYYDYDSDLILQEDFLDAIDGSVTIGPIANLDDAEECLILFYWDGESSIVQDVDYFIWGGTDGAVSKTVADGYPSDDTPIEEQYPIRSYLHSDIVDSLFKRISFEENGEILTAGNGITGHDETSEDLSLSWQIVPLYEVIQGCTDPNAANYDPEANVDDGSCLISILSILLGDYDGDQVTVEGVIIDFFDVTPFGGPYAVTIQDFDGNSLEVTIWPDDWDILNSDQAYLLVPPFGGNFMQITGIVGEYEGEKQLEVSGPDGFIFIAIAGCTDIDALNYNPDATLDSENCFYEYPSIQDILEGVYDGQSVTVQGMLIDYFDVTVYNGPHSLTIEGNEGYRLEISVWPDDWDIPNSDKAFLLKPPYGIYYIQATGAVGEYEGEKQLGVTSSEDLIITGMYDIDGDFIEDTTIVKAEINPAPFVIIPTLGEVLEYSYKRPSHSRVIIRIFDFSGRFITSLKDDYRDHAGITGGSDKPTWDGRDHLGQIVPPGTYFIHIEASNFQTGKTTTDVAPIVVGVKF